MRRDITFLSEGIACRGWHYTPDNGAAGHRVPTIVLAHGFSAVKEMRLDRFAEAFAEAGLATLVFDYRGFGASDSILLPRRRAARRERCNRFPLRGLRRRLRPPVAHRDVTAPPGGSWADRGRLVPRAFH